MSTGNLAGSTIQEQTRQALINCQYYGVGSRPLGNDRIDEDGPNVGFDERASAAEICDYYSRVLDENLRRRAGCGFSA